MSMLAIQMVLGLVAGWRGWRAWVLVPLLISAAALLAVLRAPRMSEEAAEALTGSFLVLEMGVSVALLYMSVVGRGMVKVQPLPVKAGVRLGVERS